MNDLKNIKEILQNYEAEYNHQDWIKLEKDLPKPGMSGMTKTLLVATSIIVTVTAAIFFINKYDKNTKSDSSEKEIVSNTINNNNNSEIKTNNGNDNSNTIVLNEIDSSDQNSEIINKNASNENIFSNENESDIINESDNTTITENIETEEHVEEISEQESNNIENHQNEVIEENSIPDISTASFTTTINNNCIPSTIQFEAKDLPSNCELIWNTGDNTRVYGNQAEYTYTDDGSFYPEVNITYKDKLLKNIKLDEITLNSPPIAKIIFDNSENLYYFSCDNEGDIDLLWTIDNQEFRKRDVEYTFNKSADYLIKLSIENQFGCKSVASESISIEIEHILYFPNAFIPNANGVNSEFGPIGENMNFENYQLLIVDGHGKVVFTSNDVDFKWNGKVNNIGENAKPGFYLWEVKTMDKFGNIQTKKGRVNLIWN